MKIDDTDCGDWTDWPVECSLDAEGKLCAFWERDFLAEGAEGAFCVCGIIAFCLPESTVAATEPDCSVGRAFAFVGKNLPCVGNYNEWLVGRDAAVTRNERDGCHMRELFVMKVEDTVRDQGLPLGKGLFGMDAVRFVYGENKGEGNNTCIEKGVLAVHASVGVPHEVGACSLGLMSSNGYCVSFCMTDLVADGLALVVTFADFTRAGGLRIEAAILAEDSGTIGTDKEAGDLLFGAAHKKKDTEPSGIKSGGYRVEIKW